MLVVNVNELEAMCSTCSLLQYKLSVTVYFCLCYKKTHQQIRYPNVMFF